MPVPRRHSIASAARCASLTPACGAGIFAHVVVVQFIEKPLLGLLTVLLIFNLTQRNHLEHGEGKRFASLGLAGLVLLLFVSALAVVRYRLPDYLLLVPALLVTFIALRFRASLFLFKLRCTGCGSPLPIKTTLYRDDNLCPHCRQKEE